MTTGRINQVTALRAGREAHSREARATRTGSWVPRHEGAGVFPIRLGERRRPPQHNTPPKESARWSEPLGSLSTLPH